MNIPMLLSGPRPRLRLRTANVPDRSAPESSIDPAAMGEGSPAGGARQTRTLTRGQIAIAIFLAWTIVGVFQTVPEVIKGIQTHVFVQWYIFAAKVIEAWAWILLTPALLLIDRKVHSKGPNIAGAMFVFLSLSVPFSVVHTYLTGVLLYPIHEVTWNPLSSSDFANYYNIGGWVTYCAAVGVLQAVRFYNGLLMGQLQLERVGRNLVETRLNALRLQLEPHFLFNALNAISSEVVTRPHLAQDMIADLGTLLRLSLDSRFGAEISLAQELVLLDRYLSIQKIRFGKRIEIKLEVEPGAVSARVPSMLLQPLVENAFRHGVEGRRSGATIAVSASRVGNRLKLSVADNGRGLPEGWKLENSAGHGLRVTLERLVTLYPDCDGDCLTIGRRAGGGTEVTVLIPFCAEEPDGTTV